MAEDAEGVAVELQEAQDDGPVLGTDLDGGTPPRVQELLEGAEGGSARQQDAQAPAAPETPAWDPSSVDWRYVREEDIPEALRETYKPLIEQGRRIMREETERREQLDREYQERLRQEPQTQPQPATVPAASQAPAAPQYVRDNPQWTEQLVETYRPRNDAEREDLRMLTNIASNVAAVMTEGMTTEAQMQSELASLRAEIADLKSGVTEARTAPIKLTIQQEVQEAYGKYSQAEVDPWSNQIAALRGTVDPITKRVFTALTAFERVAGKDRDRSQALSEAQTTAVNGGKAKAGAVIGTPAGAVVETGGKPISEREADVLADRLLGN